MACPHCGTAGPETVLPVYARHVVKLFLNLLSINLLLSLAFLKALDPRSQPHLNDWHPDYEAAVIYFAIKHVDLVEHPLVVLLRHPHVLLDHLYFLFQGLHLDVVDLILELALLILLELDHLVFGHLALFLIDHLDVKFALEVFLAEHGNDVLEVVLLEAMVGRDLEVRDEEFCVLRVTCQGHGDEGVVWGVGKVFHLVQEFLKLVNINEASRLGVVLLPDLFDLVYLLFEF